MIVRIGIVQTAKELDIDLGDVKVDDVKKDVDKQRSDGTLWLTDKNGRAVGIPGDKIAYIELGSDKAEHRIGFVG